MFAAHQFAGKKVGVFGLARSGLAVIEALQLGGAEVLAYDDNRETVARQRTGGVPVADLRAVDFATLDALVLSPGVPLTHPKPHWSVDKARAAGIEIISDTEVFCREVAANGAKTVCITGTNGKSTTTALTGHVLARGGLDVQVGGNIGTAVFLLKPPVKGRVYVLELSSYQIDLMPGLKPDVAILMNLSPDHLDRHGSMEHYAQVKARIFARQDAGCTAIVSVDDQWSAAIASGLDGQSAVVPVSVERTLTDGVSAPGGLLRDGRDGSSIDLGGMRSLRGRHNWQNACAAYGAARALGLDAGQIAQAMQSFPGLAHRMEEVGRCGPVVFVNDSKATNSDAAAFSLASFDNIFWIAGGRAKRGGIEPLAHLFGRIKRAYLIGEAAEDFQSTLAGTVDTVLAGTLERAFQGAARDAAASGLESAVVLLAPACSSFDQYPDFEKRGQEFCALAKRLAGMDATQERTQVC